MTSFRERKSVVRQAAKVNVVRNAGTDVEFILQQRNDRVEEGREDREAVEMGPLGSNSPSTEAVPEVSCWSSIDMKDH